MVTHVVEIDYTVSGGVGDYWHVDGSASNDDMNPSYLSNWYTVNKAQYSYTYLGGLNRNETGTRTAQTTYKITVGCRRTIAFTSGTAQVSIENATRTKILARKTVTLTNDIAQVVTLHVKSGSKKSPIYFEQLHKLNPRNKASAFYKPKRVVQHRRAQANSFVY